MSAIPASHAREILDSRGNPTVEVEMRLESGAWGRAARAVGRLHGQARGGRAARRRRASATAARACSSAVQNVERGDRARDRGAWRPASRRPIDRALLELDGTPNKSATRRQRASSASRWPRRARRPTTRACRSTQYLGGPGARHPAGAADERAQRRRPRRQRPRHPGVHARARRAPTRSARRCAWAWRSSTRSRSC